MPRSRYMSRYLATTAGWAPSHERKRRSGRVGEEGSDRWVEDTGVCGSVSGGKEEEEGTSAEGGSLALVDECSGVEGQWAAEASGSLSGLEHVCCP